MVAAVLVFLPKLPDVVAHTSTTYLPNSNPSVVAGRLADRVDPAHRAQSTVIVAIHRAGGLTQADRAYLEGQLARVGAQKDKYSVSYVEDANNAPAGMASAFVSGDKTTEIAIVGLQSNIEDPGLSAILDRLHNAFAGAPEGAHVYLTGDTPVQKDAITLMQGAADKTAAVTVTLVLVILLAVFRAVLAPLLTLLAIGLSYLVSSSVVAWLAVHGFPVSTFTQTFMIAVLFGAGTDYTVILLNRFREELTRNGTTPAALASALRGVGKTVVFSSLTVLVSFAALYFANFGLYRSGVGVAVGVAITLLTCLTLIPALMALLGRSLFWPVIPKPGQDHRPSRLWGWSSRLSTRRPWVVMLALAVLLTPVAFLVTAFIVNFMNGIQAPAYPALLARMYPPALRGRLMGYVRVAQGTLLIPLAYVVGQWSQHQGDRWPLIGAALMGTLSVILFSRVREVEPADPQGHPEARRRRIHPIFGNWQVARASRPLTIFLVATMVTGFGNLLAGPIYQIYQVHTLNLSNAQIGFTRVLYYVALLVAYFAVGWIIDTWSPRRAMFIGMGAYALAPALYVLDGSFTAVMISCALLGVGDAVWDIGCMSYIFRAVPGREAEAFGLHFLLFGVRGAIAPLVSTAMTHAMSLTDIFLIAIGICALGIALFAVPTQPRAPSRQVEAPQAGTP
ncbi:MAG: MFS transporter [Alicyclobacillus sp.]|nr:MFS transporter [Alicyclobacillus sp.]